MRLLVIPRGSPDLPTRCYTRPCARGASQSAKRAVPTRHNRTEGYEPSFSLTAADSRRVMKGEVGRPERLADLNDEVYVRAFAFGLYCSKLPSGKKIP